MGIQLPPVVSAAPSDTAVTNATSVAEVVILLGIHIPIESDYGYGCIFVLGYFAVDRSYAAIVCYLLLRSS